MSKMLTTIHAYNAKTRTVPVTFANGDIQHRRNINAVLTDNGEYDKKATAARVEEVGRGVAIKMGLGVIAAPIADAGEEA